MSKGVHNIAFYVSPDPECSRTTQNSEISLAPSRGRILYAIYGNSTCVINHIVVTAIDKMYRNYYVSTSSVEGAYAPGEDDHIRDAIRAFREVCMTLIPNTSSYIMDRQQTSMRTI